MYAMDFRYLLGSTKKKKEIRSLKLKTNKCHFTKIQVLHVNFALFYVQLPLTRNYVGTELLPLYVRYIVTNKRNSCTYLTSVICNRSYWKKFDIHSYLQPTVRLSPATAPFSQVCDRPIDRSTIQFYSHLLFVIMFCPYVPIIVFLSFAFFRCGSIHPFSPPLFPPVPISSC